MPILTNVTVFPRTRQTLVVSELKRTTLPDAPPVAVTVYEPPTNPGSGGIEVKLIDCGCGATTVKVCVACGAAEYPFPAG